MRSCSPALGGGGEFSVPGFITDSNTGETAGDTNLEKVTNQTFRVEHFTTFGAAGDETGTGVTVSGVGVFFSGILGAQTEGIVGQFTHALPVAPVWTRTWPGLANVDWFNGIALRPSGLYVVGGSWSRTSDSVGGKETKGITIRFNLDGTAGGGVAGSVWDRQTPASPGGFPYGGIEWLTGVTAATQGGQNFLLTAGFGERTGFTNLWGTFVSKLDEAGNVLWTRNDSTATRYPTNPAVAATNDAVYMATRKDVAGAQPYLKKWDAAGALQWTRTTTTAGEYRGVAVADSRIVAVGQTETAGGTSDFLVDAWDPAGNLLWMRTYDLGGASEVLNAVVASDGRLFAVGSTAPSGAGATSDAIILELDGATGDLASSAVWGGPSDDSLAAVAFAELAEGPRLFAVGTTRSHGAGGADIALLRVDPTKSNAVWTELQVTGTAPPHLHPPQSVFYDSKNNRLIAFFSGSPSIKPYGNEVWIITHANGLGGTPEWIKLLPTGTAPRSNVSESVVYDAVNNRLTVYGGCAANCSPALSDVFVLTSANGLGSPPAWIKSTVSNPQARSYHSAVYDSVSNRMIAFGGNSAFFGTDKNDTRILTNANGLASPSAWTTLLTSGGPPGIRNSHTAVYDEVGRNMIVFGGSNFIRTCCPYIITDYTDAWMLSDADGLSGTPLWTQIVPGTAVPPGRSLHSAVYDPANDRMIVFGGAQWQQDSQTSVPLGDLWELRNATAAAAAPEWVELAQSGQAPGPRFYHGAAWDVANQRMVVLSGRDGTNVAHRLWVLAPGKGTTPPVNQFPVANAGASRSVPVNRLTTLDGRGSYDPDGETITSAWSFLSRPAGSSAQLTGVNTLQPSFVPDLAGQYRIRLDVTDPHGASTSALVTITATTANQAPVAVIAAVPLVSGVPTERRLGGRGSYDPDGDPITFRWRLSSKPSNSKKASLSGVSNPDPVLYMDVAGNYVVELTVWDRMELSGKASLTITAVAGGSVSPPPPNPPAVVCRLSFGVTADGSWQTQFYRCNDRRITQEAVQRTGDTDLIDSFTQREGDVATWRFGEKTGNSLGFTGSFAYYANCTRNPSATPLRITDVVFPPNTIEMSITVRTVKASVCNSAGANCKPMQTRVLPTCATQ